MLRLVSKYLNARLARVSVLRLYTAGGASLFRPVADRNEKPCEGIWFLAMPDAREWGCSWRSLTQRRYGFNSGSWTIYLGWRPSNT